MDNLLAKLPTSLAEELVEVIAKGDHVRIERIVSTGQSSPEGFWYDQGEDEWVMVVTGEAKLRFQDARGIVSMKPGDHVYIAAHEKHRVEWTTPAAPTVWLAVFYQPLAKTPRKIGPPEVSRPKRPRKEPRIGIPKKQPW